MEDNPRNPVASLVRCLIHAVKAKQLDRVRALVGQGLDGNAEFPSRFLAAYGMFNAD